MTTPRRKREAIEQMEQETHRGMREPLPPLPDLRANRPRPLTPGALLSLLDAWDEVALSVQESEARARGGHSGALVCFTEIGLQSAPAEVPEIDSTDVHAWLEARRARRAAAREEDAA